jgi:hypothetical protein
MKLDALFPTVISNSLISDKTCYLSWFRANCQKLTNGFKNSHLIAGGHFASACEIVRKAYYNEDFIESEAIEKGRIYILEAEDTGDAIKTNERLAATLEKYFKRFPLSKEFSPAKLADGTHAIEYTFAFDLGIPHPDIPDRNLLWMGKLDGLYEKIFQGKVSHRFVLDEKTASELSRIINSKDSYNPNGVIDINKEEDKYRTDSQFIGYHKAARLLGIKTDSTLVRKVPILTKHEDAIELNIPITDFMIDIWWSTFLSDINELVEKYRFYKSKNMLPQVAFKPAYKGTICTSWGRKCEYIEGCLHKDGEAILAGSMKQLVSNQYEALTNMPLVEYKQQLGIK